MANSTDMLFPSLNMTEEGRVLLVKAREMFPNTIAQFKQGMKKHLEKDFRVTDVDKIIEMLRDECYEVVATIFAATRNLSPTSTTMERKLPPGALPSYFLVEAIMAMGLSDEFSHVNETHPVARAVHAQMHASSMVGLLTSEIERFAQEAEEEHVDKIQVRH